MTTVLEETWGLAGELTGKIWFLSYALSTWLVGMGQCNGRGSFPKDSKEDLDSSKPSYWVGQASQRTGLGLEASGLF